MVPAIWAGASEQSPGFVGAYRDDPRKERVEERAARICVPSVRWAVSFERAPPAAPPTSSGEASIRKADVLNGADNWNLPTISTRPSSRALRPG